MPKQTVNGAKLACSMGLAPSSLVVLPLNRTDVASQYSATVRDYIPMLNIQPFGMCTSPANPQVAAATAAALGVLTPQPCIPATMSPWTPGSPTVQIANQIALNDVSICSCMWSGVISITDPGQETTEIP
jgi:hypothetical protein